MDWAKVDAALAAALAGASAEEALPVFVQVDRAAAGDEALGRLNLGDAGDVATASLSPAELDALTDHHGVVFVRLSGHLRLLVEPGASQAAGDQEAGAHHGQGPAQQDQG